MQQFTEVGGIYTDPFDHFVCLISTDDAIWHCLTLATCYQLAQFVLIGFALAKKVGWGGGRVSAWGAVHMAAALAGCRKALVGTG